LEAHASDHRRGLQHLLLQRSHLPIHYRPRGARPPRQPRVPVRRLVGAAPAPPLNRIDPRSHALRGDGPQAALYPFLIAELSRVGPGELGLDYSGLQDPGPPESDRDDPPCQIATCKPTTVPTTNCTLHSGMAAAHEEIRAR